MGCFQKWLAYRQKPLENLTGEEEVNSLTQLLSGIDEFQSGIDELQPRKVEELLPNDDIVSDTYLIYPTGGYHPFYGVSNTLPRYQLPIWPYIKRIKFHKRWKSEKGMNNVRRGNLKKHTTHLQLNYYLEDGYMIVPIFQNRKYLKNEYTKVGRNGHYKYITGCKKLARMHKLVALAFIPNPKKKPLVMHINDDRTNYLIENLKWGTARENMRGKKFRNPDTMEQKYLNLVNKGVIKG